MGSKKKPAAAATPKKRREPEAPKEDDTGGEVETKDSEEKENTDTAEAEPSSKPASLLQATPKRTAKTKAKCKSKAKAKAKAKSKSKAQTSKKKPATNNDAPEEEPKPKKKTKSVMEMAANWQLASKSEEKVDQEEGEEEEGEADPEVDPASGEKRSYPKARKWARLAKANAIPEDIVALFENGSKQSQNPRLFKTQFINAIFTTNRRGEYMLTPGNPSFSAFRKNTEKHMSGTGTTGMPYSIMLWQCFQGNEQAMKQAETCGDIVQISGLWHYKTAMTSSTKSTQHTMQAHGGEADLTNKQYEAVSSFLGNRPWAQFGQAEQPLGFQREDLPAIASSANPPKTLKAICDTPVYIPFSKVENNLKEAKGAQERLNRDCQKLAVKVSQHKDSELITELKDVMAKLSSNEQTIQSALLFQEIPDTNMQKEKVEEFWKNLGSVTERCNERIEQIKATCKVRQWT